MNNSTYNYLLASSGGTYTVGTLPGNTAGWDSPACMSNNGYVGGGGSNTGYPGYIWSPTTSAGKITGWNSPVAYYCGSTPGQPGRGRRLNLRCQQCGRGLWRRLFPRQRHPGFGPRPVFRRHKLRHLPAVRLPRRFRIQPTACRWASTTRGRSSAGTLGTTRAPAASTPTVSSGSRVRQTPRPARPTT